MRLFTNSRQYLALAGDVICLGIVILIGFSSHGTLGTAGLRILSTLVPLVLSWWLISPFFGLYHPQAFGDVRQLWRPLYAMAFVVPLGAWVRGLILGLPIQPVFVAVIFATCASAVVLWRAILLGIVNLKSRVYG
jgi:hypothetical protein